MNDAPRFRNALGEPRDLDLVWWLLPVALTAIGFGLLPLRSWDYWWHITMGRLIHAWDAVPAANHYLYTMYADTPSFIQPWLAEWLLFVAHRIAPVYGGLFIRNLVVVGVVWWLTASGVRRSGSVQAGSLAAVFGLFFLAGLAELRPHLFALPLFAGAIAMIDARRRQSMHAGWVLPIFGLLGCAWANLHGSFPLAVVIPLLVAAGGLIERVVRDKSTPLSPWIWVGASGTAAIGTLVNPRTSAVWGYVVDVANNPEAQQTVSEWWPTYAWAPHGLGALFWISLTGLASAALYRWWKSGEWDAPELVLAVAFAGLAALQRRSLVWWAVILPWALAPQLGFLWRRWVAADTSVEDIDPGKLPTILAATLVCLGCLAQPTWQWRVDLAAAIGLHDVRREAPLKGVVPADLPVESTHILRQSGRPRVFHAQKYAGYLMYRLTDEHPARRVFVDHRIELPDRRIWQTFRQTSRGEQWDTTFKKYAIRAALLNARTQQPLIDALDASDAWVRTYRRADHALFVPASWQHDDGPTQPSSSASVEPPSDSSSR
jgi:hypothetical protein